MATKLRHYRTLETVREKWDAREQKALNELDRLRGDKTGVESTDYTALFGQLEEVQQEQRTLREGLNQSESLIDNLRVQLEECQLEKGGS